MKRSRFTDEQASYALKLAEQGTAVKDVCHKFGITEATALRVVEEVRWPGPIEVRELHQLREENGRLKKLVADLTLDKHILTEVVQ